MELEPEVLPVNKELTVSEVRKFDPRKWSKNKKIIAGAVLLVILLLCCVLLYVSFFFYRAPAGSNNNSSSQTSSQNSTVLASASSSSRSSSRAVQSSATETTPTIAFVRYKVNDDSLDDEIWLTEADGSNQHGLGIMPALRAYKNPGSALILYEELGSDKAFVINYLTDEKFAINPPEVAGSKAITKTMDYFPISPDNKVFLVSVSYLNDPCLEKGCFEDPYPDAKTGVYAYHVDTDELVYIGNFGYGWTWSKDSKNIYTNTGADYHDQDLTGFTYKINVDTGAAVRLDALSFFSELNIYDEATTRINFGGNTDSVNKLNLIKAGVSTTVDSGSWADIQPFITFSPDYSFAVYARRNSRSSRGIVFFNKQLINIATGTKSLLVEPAENVSYGLVDYWLDNNTFYTSETLNIEAGDSLSYQTDIVVINLDGTKDKITEFGDVRLQ